MLPVYDVRTDEGRAGVEATLRRLRASSSIDSQWYGVASKLIASVRERGDAAVVEQMRQFADAGFAADRIRVTEAELASARAKVDDRLWEAILRAIDHVRRYQAHILPRDAEPLLLDGAELGLRWTPIEPVGLLVPGGSAVLFSTLIMLAVPAIVAGVDPAKISVVSQPRYRREGEPAADVSPITLAVCHELGIGRVYRIGGAEGAAAMALGTESVEPVSFLAGPGHSVVQATKLQLRGVVGTDDYYGASEIVTVVDASADPRRVAADLIAQAEHDPGKCFLIAWSDEVLERVLREVEAQARGRERFEAIGKALREESCAVRVEDENAAAEAADRFAAEHVNLAVADPDGFLARVCHGGEFFLGDATPVAAGDYYAGPSHTLPTGTTARFSSGVSVYTFLKRSGTVAYRQGMPVQVIDDISRMAEAEGLDGHAASVRARSVSPSTATRIRSVRDEA